MKRFEKFLVKPAPKDRAVIDHVLEKIFAFDFEGLNMKKLTGFNIKYRVRKGNVRIVFFIEGKEITIEKIGRKNDNTYK